MAQAHVVEVVEGVGDSLYEGVVIGVKVDFREVEDVGPKVVNPLKPQGGKGR